MIIEKLSHAMCNVQHLRHYNSPKKNHLTPNLTAKPLIKNENLRVAK